MGVGEKCCVSGVSLLLGPERAAGQRDLFLEPQIERLVWILEAIGVRFLIEDVGKRRPRTMLPCQFVQNRTNQLREGLESFRLDDLAAVSQTPPACGLVAGGADVE